MGVPKTIDNDIDYLEKTFGFDTAVSLAQGPIAGAHEEARSYRNGIGIVKLMGRDSGFIALHASLASSDVNLVLLPEVPFDLETIVPLIEARLKSSSGHCLIVVSEGAGQSVLQAAKKASDAKEKEKDASGNVLYDDIGVFLKNAIGERLKAKGLPHSIKYIDPSYSIRSAKANPEDAVFAVILAQMAVHAAMAGKTNLLVGRVNHRFVHIPIRKAIEKRKKVDVAGVTYQAILDNTGMPMKLCV